MTNDAPIPIYGFVRGDVLGVLVLVRGNDSIATLTATLTEAAGQDQDRIRLSRLQAAFVTNQQREAS